MSISIALREAILFSFIVVISKSSALPSSSDYYSFLSRLSERSELSRFAGNFLLLGVKEVFGGGLCFLVRLSGSAIDLLTALFLLRLRPSEGSLLLLRREFANVSASRSMSDKRLISSLFCIGLIAVDKSSLDRLFFERLGTARFLWESIELSIPALWELGEFSPLLKGLVTILGSLIPDFLLLPKPLSRPNNKSSYSSFTDFCRLYLFF